MDAVFQKRIGDNEDLESSREVAALETARSAAESSSAGKPEEKKDDEKMSLFWRVFGGTILSIAALVGITLFNNIYANIGDLRAELIKKDEFNTRSTSIYDRIRSFDTMKAEMEGLRERVTANGSALDGLKKDSAATLDAAKKEVGAIADGVKKDAASLEVLKERVANLETVKKDIAGLDLLKERLVTAAADLRSLRDDVSKVQQEVERNRIGDQERKTSRDTQFKQVDETIKELQKGLQDCREKLARLEGMQPAAGYGPAARPVPPASAKPWFPVETPPHPVPPGESKGSGAGGDAGSAKPPGTGSPATSKPGPGGERD